MPISQQPKAPPTLELFPEDTREAAELLKQAIPHMVRHDIPANTLQYALWYSYCQGTHPELNRRMEKTLEDFSLFPPEVSSRLFRDFIIRGELEEARADQHGH